MSVRSDLRAKVFEWADNQCEHPFGYRVGGSSDSIELIPVRCFQAATELAHIYPRGMGHTGYRDTIGNVMAACELHARSTDDLSSPEWQNVPAPHDRKALQEWVRERRVRDGWEAMEGF